MRVGVQFTASLAAGQTHRWFTFNWNPASHVIWTVVPTSIRAGAPQISWDVQVERASATAVTYWLTIRNLTASPLDFEARFAIVN